MEQREDRRLKPRDTEAVTSLRSRFLLCFRREGRGPELLKTGRRQT